MVIARQWTGELREFVTFSYLVECNRPFGVPLRRWQGLFHPTARGWILSDTPFAVAFVYSRAFVQYTEVPLSLS